MPDITKFVIIRAVVRFLRRYLSMDDHRDIFETIIPWQCIPDSLAIVRSGQYTRENTGKLMQHAGYFLGCSGKMIEGVGPDDDTDDDEPKDDWLFRSEMPVSAMADEDITNRLDECCARASAGFSGPNRSIPWQAIWQIAGPLLMELLKRWLEKQSKE